MPVEESMVDRNLGAIAPAVAGESSMPETEEVARKAAADVQKITTLEDKATKAQTLNSGDEAKTPDSGLGVIADVAMDALGIGPVGKIASAGITMAEDRTKGSKSPTSQAPAEDAFEAVHRQTMRAPGLYRNEHHASEYGGDPKTTKFPAVSSKKTSGLFEQVSLATSSLKKQDSAGLFDNTPKNLATMDADKATKKITEGVGEAKQMASILRNKHELAQQSVRPAMEANYAARGAAMKMAPGMAPSPNMRPNDVTNAAKNYVSRYDDPDNWRTGSTS